VLVTGGAGFIGSHLVGALVARGDTVTVLDDLSTGRRENLAPFTGPRIELVEGTIADRRLVRELVGRTDRIFHLAAAVGVELILRDPLRVLETNVMGTHVVLEAAADAGRAVLLASSSEIYGKSESLPFSEDADRQFGPTTQWRWAYGESKAIDETLALAFHRQRGLPVVIARLFNTVGPRQSGAYGMVLPRFVAAARARRPLRVHGDGKQTRTFCDVRDTVIALVSLLDEARAVGGVFNVGGEREISILGLAHLVLSELGEAGGDTTDERVTLVPYAAAYEPGFEDLRRRRPDTRRLRELTGWSPRIPLEATIAAIAEELARSPENG
jgi:UDP-glucose 4-epimerase